MQSLHWLTAKGFVGDQTLEPLGGRSRQTVGELFNGFDIPHLEEGLHIYTHSADDMAFNNPLHQHLALVILPDFHKGL